MNLNRSENEAVLAYLESERVASPGTNTAWVIDGYSLSTHPDLCDRLKEINEAAGKPASVHFLYGKPALVAPNGVIAAFAGGTYVLCVRVAADEVDARVVGERKEKLSGHELLRAKQEQLDELVRGDWTRVDAWTVDIPKEEGLHVLAGLLRRAVENV